MDKQQHTQTHIDAHETGDVASGHDSPSASGKATFFPLVSLDSPLVILQIAQCNTSLLECIRIIHGRKGGLLRRHLTPLTIIATQLAILADRAARQQLERLTEIHAGLDAFFAGDTDDELDCDTTPDRGVSAETGIEYRDTPARTRRVAVLYLALMACIREISKKSHYDEPLHAYLEDLTTIAREISRTLCQSLNQTLRR